MFTTRTGTKYIWFNWYVLISEKSFHHWTQYGLESLQAHNYAWTIKKFQFVMCEIDRSIDSVISWCSFLMTMLFIVSRWHMSTFHWQIFIQWANILIHLIVCPEGVFGNSICKSLICFSCVQYVHIKIDQNSFKIEYDL